MLKGIKKGKVPEDQTINKNKQPQKMELQIQQKIAMSKNKKNLKDQYILEDQLELENQKNMIQQADKQIIVQNSKYNAFQMQEQIKECARQILQNFFKGQIQTLKQKLRNFQILQDRLNQEQLIKQCGLKKQEPIISQKLITQLEVASDKKNILPQQKKSKFAYQFNYESDEQKEKPKTKKKNYKPLMRSDKIQQYCLYCPQNQELKLISASNYAYLAFPKKKTFKKYWHFILASVQHNQTTIGLNQDVLTEISNYKKCLLQMFDQKRMHVIFFQQFSAENSHIYIQCLAMPLTKGQDLPFFFKQSLQSIQGNWTTHKNIIKIQKQKGGLIKQIPKKMKYFYIDFSLGYGYAHVIQNQKFWNRQFCYEILATALGLEKYEVKTTEEYSQQQNILRLKQFQKLWQKYDWTKLI